MRDLNLTDAQRAEVEKYVRIYDTDGRYRMGMPRRRFTLETLKALYKALSPDLPRAPSLLDVGAGRGETIAFAIAAGFDPALGVECVPSLLNDRVDYGVAWDLPATDNSVDVVTCLDVLEHIRREDVEASLAELARVARHRVFIGVANHDSRREGVQLHVTQLPFDEWTGLLSEAFQTVRPLPGAFGTKNQHYLCTPKGGTA